MSRPIVALASFIVALAAVTGCSRSGDQSLPARLGTLFSEAHADGEFNGNVLVTRDGAVVYQASFGAADRERNIANAADTKFLAFDQCR
jgi:CubicO group peptidase (beta-lactamase class C family)